MSATTKTSTVDVQNDTNNEQRIAEARYTFKTTVANKEKTVTVALKPKTKLLIQNIVVNNPMWRSDSQFICDALIYYLNDDDAEVETAQELLEQTEWTSETNIGACITQELFDEIDLLVNHSHTTWDSKQEIIICAIQSYNNANHPVVTQR